MKQGITVRFFCKYKKCKRKYNLVNKFLHADEQVFVIRRQGAICHDQLSCERRKERKKPISSGPKTRVTSVANIENVHDNEVSEIFVNMKQEAMAENSENSYDYS